MALSLRPARIADAKGPGLLYVSAQPYYDAYAGSEAKATRMLDAVWSKRGHTAAHDHCTLALVDGTIAGALVAFAAEDGDALARRFLARLPPPARRAALARCAAPPARVRPGHARAARRARCTWTRWRSRPTTVAGAWRPRCSESASVEARQRGLRGVSLDTGLENAGAQALYEGFGFAREGERHAPSERIAAAIGGPGFVSYFKRGTR